MDPDKPTKTKLGITKNPSNRIKAYKTAAPGCYFQKIYELPDSVHEKKILDILKDRFKVESEYVHCHPQIVQNIVEGYLIDHQLD